ncbi:MAG TPA: TrmH family RNA methyltransferase [Thermoleophilaceae bacterium]|nr:TrmH family RNA methyltransferase [Thermoleophilaceae bacterium]
MEQAARDPLIARFRAARSDDDLAILEGFHALKHALRFGAEVEAVLSSDAAELRRLSEDLAPDLEQRLRELTTEVSEDTYRELGGYAHHTRVAAIARRPAFAAAQALDRRDAPVVLLEDPRHLGNLGAVVRVAAAVDAAGVLTTGEQDPWDPVAIRGSGGLHFALPVGRVGRRDGGGFATGDSTQFDTGGRPLFAVDPDGTPIDPAALPADAIYAFGSERHGLSAQLVSRADARLRIPMRPGVSSLNLATSVSAVLFAWRLCGR